MLEYTQPMNRATNIICTILPSSGGRGVQLSVHERLQRCQACMAASCACTKRLSRLCACVQVFDDKATFAEWFGDVLGKGGPGTGAGDEWLRTEKRVVVIHRLHQILEPFMLRRQVQDVEGKLPPKVTCFSVLLPLTRSHSQDLRLSLPSTTQRRHTA